VPSRRAQHRALNPKCRPDDRRPADGPPPQRHGSSGKAGQSLEKESTPTLEMPGVRGEEIPGMFNACSV
jgi:hypothetical protein